MFVLFGMILPSLSFCLFDSFPCLFSLPYTHFATSLLLSFYSVISTVMGQTVALDFYAVVVDQMLDTFTILNTSVERTGAFSAMETKSLFKVVAQNNTVFIGMITKINLLERSDTAWNFAEYGPIFEGTYDTTRMLERLFLSRLTFACYFFHRRIDELCFFC
jgi:hypothetical protein